MVKADELSFDAIADVWVNFIKSYKPSKKKKNIYDDEIISILANGRSSIVVDYDHISDAIINQNREEFEFLDKYILNNPDEARDTLAVAALTCLKEHDEEFTMAISPIFRAEFINIPVFKEFHEINSEDYGKFRTVEGLVIEKDEDARTWFKKAVWRCPSEHKTVKLDSYDAPTKCSGLGEPGAEPEPCGEKSFNLVESETVRDDYFEIKIQQRPDKAKDSAIARVFMIKGRDLVKTIIDDIHFGDYVTVSCIIRGKPDKTNKSLANYIMELSSITKKPESALAEDDPDMMNLVEDVTEKDYPKIVNSVAPSIWTPDSDILKEVIILLLVGSDPKIRTDGTRIRGEHQGLIIGSPGTAKSSIAKWIMNTRPRVIYNSGANTSAVGLVGGMKQGEDKRWVVAAGAFGLAGKKGIVVIDEFARRPQDHFDALAEVMSDEQTITIAKGGYRKITQTDSAVLAISNPNTKSLRYDNRLDLFSNTKIPPNILNRFDWIFCIRDVVDEFHDRSKYERYIKGYNSAIPESKVDERKSDFKRMDVDHFPVIFIKHWIQHVRNNFHPVVTDTPDVVEFIYKFFRRYRKLNIRMPKDDKERETFTKDDEVPAVDFRTLGAIFRLTEARARAGHRNECTMDDAKTAIRIIEASIASTGFNPYDGAMESTVKNVEFTQLEREAKEGWAKQLYRQLKIFTTGLEKLSWERCQECSGSGMVVIPELNEPEPCELCGQRGGTRQPFSREDLEIYCTGRQIALKAFASIWSKYIKTGEIVKDGAYFINKMPHIDHYVKKMEEDLSEENILKQSIARTDPAIMRRLEEDEV